MPIFGDEPLPELVIGAVTDVEPLPPAALTVTAPPTFDVVKFVSNLIDVADVVTVPPTLFMIAKGEPFELNAFQSVDDK
jgi:hypothetical protein